MGISLSGGLVHLRAAGIAQAHGACHLVEGLAGRVVPGASDDLKLAVIFHNHQMGVPARHDQADKRRLQIGIFYKVCRNVPLNMVHAHQGLLRRVGDGLGLRHTH